MSKERHRFRGPAWMRVMLLPTDPMLARLLARSR